MWALTKNLCPESVRAKAPFTSKKKALEALGNQLTLDQDNLSHAGIFQGLLHREKLGSTGIGKGIAIPHGRFKEITEPALAVLTTVSAIDFDSADNQPVDIFIALAVPENANDEHLHLLAQITALLRQPEFCEALRNSTSNEALYNAVLMATVMHSDNDNAVE